MKSFSLLEGENTEINISTWLFTEYDEAWISHILHWISVFPMLRNIQ